MRLTDDWGGADFIAQHIDGETFLRVQLKGRLTFDTKYQNKGLFIAFPYAKDWYMFLHDELLAIVLADTNTMSGTRSWDENGQYSFGHLAVHMLQLLAVSIIVKHIIVKQHPTTISTSHQMINRTGILKSRRTRHSTSPILK